MIYLTYVLTELKEIIYHILRVNVAESTHVSCLLFTLRSLQSHSTHWRATCSFPTHGVDFTDYVRGNFKDLNIVNFLDSGKCKKVNYVNIRGHVGIHLTARFWQSTSWMLRIDSSHSGCNFKTRSGSVTSED